MTPGNRTYSLLADLPLAIDGYALEGLSRRVSTGFRRFTTVFRLSGAGHEGLGEDVTYEAAEQRRLVRSGPVLALAGEWTLDGFSRALDQLDLFPDGAPEHATSRTYRRWALESAALDLALRQAGRPLHEVLGLEPRPVRFVVSLNLGAEPSCGALESRLAACAGVRFKLDATPAWDAPLLECLARSGRVDAVDFKGVYQGTLAETHTDPDLYRRVAAALPGVWLEDPDLSDPAAAAALAEHRERVTWDAPIHCATDIGEQPWPARTVNIKPSRFGTLRALLDAYDHCAAGEIGVYGGGQYELGPGRGQIQYLAALFHADAPNDIAPSDYDQPTPPPDVPCSPMTVIPHATGFGADVAARAADLPTLDHHEGLVMKIEVFDPAMCCSTGVCGPSVPPALVRFAGDLQWLAGQGLDVTRYNLAHEPQAFVASESARTALTERGEQALPLILIDGEPVSSGRYPYRSELAGWAGLPIPRRRVRVAMAPAGPQLGGCCGGGGGC